MNNSPGTGPERTAILSSRDGCPVLHGFDPIEPSQLADPYEWTGKARDEMPVFFMEKYELWCLTRYDDILAVFSDPVTFSNVESHDVGIPMPRAIAEEVGEDYEFPMVGHVNVVDPPAHTRLRKLLQPAFTPRRLAHLTESVEQLADELIDSVFGQGKMDLAADFASPIPTRVIAEIIGIDPQAPEVSKFQAWADSHFQLEFRNEMDPGEALRHWTNLVEWGRFIADFVARNRAKPGDNMTTDWMNARSDEGDPRMSDEELLATILGMQGAGSDTTANLIAQTVYRLLKDDTRLWDEVVADPSLIPRAVEETLRFSGPVRGLVRTAKKDVEVGGVVIPAGSKIYLSLASANYDESRFEEPHSYDIRRTNANQHLGFGLRAHFCIGAPLARLEARVALERLVERLPGLRLENPSQEIGYTPSLISPGVHHLGVIWS